MQLKRLLALVMGILVVMTAVACGSPVPENTPDVSQDSEAIVVAVVNGENITYKEFNELMEAYAEDYNMTLFQMESFMGGEMMNKAREDVIENLVYKMVLKQKAKELGFYEFSSDVQQKIDDDIATLFANIKTYVDMEVQGLVDSGELDASQKEAEVETRYKKMIDEYGYTEEYIRSYYTDNEAITALYASVVETVKVSDDEVVASYDAELAKQKEFTASSPEEALSNFVSQINDINLYRPAGLRYVKHVLIEIPKEQRDEIYALSAQDKTASEDMYRQELAKIKETADTVLKKAKDGEDFDTLIETYGKDTGMQAEPAKTEGYCVYENSNFVKPFETAAMALEKVGDITELVESDYGYHIIRLYSLPEEGPIPFEDVAEQMKEVALYTKQDAEWETVVDTWVSQAKVTYNKDNYLKPVTSATPDATTTP
ncbi:peptidylprolyl isomerase [Clostridia bacterium OttesenSCG-928-F22]|nr:peptidylprolyl isomerase [Clostridia bacterium OttesenSCG-928-F22]